MESQVEMHGTEPRIRYNRHHLLYPRRVWQLAGSDAQYLRGEFIVKLPVELHQLLHQEVDAKLGDISVNNLPRRSIIRELAVDFDDNPYVVNCMNAVDKISWILSYLTPCYSNSWLRMMLAEEQAFLRAHQGEF